MLRALFTDMRLYLYLISIQIRAQLQYKINLAMDISTYFLVTSLEFSALLLFYTTFPTLLGWTVGEVALLAALVSISFGLAELFGAGIDEFPTLIRKGEFDRLLVRPTGIFLQVVGSDFRLRRLGRFSQGILCLLFALAILPGLHWTPDKLLVLLLGGISTMVIFIAILILGATICFWSIETTEITSLLYYGGREMLSYPMSIYHELMQRFFLFVVPLAFGAYLPVCYLLERPFPFALPSTLVFWSPLVALLFALVAGQVWRFGVLHYQSTGN